MPETPENISSAIVRREAHSRPLNAPRPPVIYIRKLIIRSRPRPTLAAQKIDSPGCAREGIAFFPSRNPGPAPCRPRCCSRRRGEVPDWRVPALADQWRFN